MRTLFGALMCLVATAALAVAIGASWASNHVQDEDGFVTMTSRLGDDDEVQAAAAALAGEAFADQPSVPAALHEPAAAAMSRAILRLTSSDGWDDAWSDTMRSTHRRLFTEPTPSDVRVDVAPIVRVAIDEVTRQLPIPVPRPDALPVVANEEDPTPVVDLVARADSIALTSAAVTVVAALLALVAARRRSSMIVALGLGAAVAAGTWWLVGRFVVPPLVRRGGEATTQGRALGDVVAQRIVMSLDPTLVWVALAGAAVVVAGLVSRALRS